MKKRAVSKMTLGEGSDYYFEFCRFDDSLHLEFGIEENLNEYITLSAKDKNYFTKLEKVLDRIKEEDYDFYCNIGELVKEKMSDKYDTRKDCSK